MTFEEWWERNSEEISADCEIALTETIKSWFRRVYAQGMMRGEKYLKDKIRPQKEADEICLACHGTGGILYEPGLIVLECRNCKGKGKV